MKVKIKGILLSFLLSQFAFAASAERVPEQLNADEVITAVRNDPSDRQARWNLSRLAFASGQYDLARSNLSYLLRTSVSNTEIEKLTRSLQRINAKDRWFAYGDLSILPSTNPQRLTYNSVFSSLLGDFTPEGGGNPESGLGIRVGFTGGVRLSWPETVPTNLYLRLDHDWYEMPDLQKSRVRLGADLTFWGTGQKTVVSPYVQFHLDNDHDATQRDLGLKTRYSRQLIDDQVFTATLIHEDRTYFDEPSKDGYYSSLSLGYSLPVDALTVSFSGSFAHRHAQAEHLRYTRRGITLSVARSLKGFGDVSVFGSFYDKRYDGIYPGTTSSREEQKVAYGVSYSPEKLRLFDSRPNFKCQIERNRSNVALFDNNATDCSMTLNRSF